MSWTTTPPTGILRTIARAPLWLFRRRLRWLLGNRFVRLTHRGRTTGRVRQTVLEVVRFDAETHEIVVATIWQGRANWYRNLQSEAALEVRTGRIAYQPAHRMLGPDETYREVSEYLQRNPDFVRSVYLRLLGLPSDAPELALRERTDSIIRGVAFRPRESVAANIPQSA